MMKFQLIVQAHFIAEELFLIADAFHGHYDISGKKMLVL